MPPLYFRFLLHGVETVSGPVSSTRAVFSRWWLSVLDRGGLLESELASLLEDLRDRWCRGNWTVSFYPGADPPAAAAPSLCPGEEVHGVEGAGRVGLGLKGFHGCLLQVAEAGGLLTATLTFRWALP